VRIDHHESIIDRHDQLAYVNWLSAWQRDDDSTGPQKIVNLEIGQLLPVVPPPGEHTGGLLDVPTVEGLVIGGRAVGQVDGLYGGGHSLGSSMANGDVRPRWTGVRRHLLNHFRISRHAPLVHDDNDHNQHLYYLPARHHPLGGTAAARGVAQHHIELGRRGDVRFDHVLCDIFDLPSG
jgi:hypothetical protein